MKRLTRRPAGVLKAAVTLLSAAMVSCQVDSAMAPTVTGISLAKAARGGGGPGPNVDATQPPSAPQDITLDVHVLGTGFDDGSVAAWTIDGVPLPEVRTNSTAFVSHGELVANITISEDAPVDLYDVEVTTSRGKKGIGADLFSVVKKGTVTFTTVELPPLQGGENSRAWGVNDAGMIVGSSSSQRSWDAVEVVTRWTLDPNDLSVTTSALETLPGWFASSAVDISDGGMAAGGFMLDEAPRGHAAVWDEGGSVHELEATPGSAPWANGVSTLGTGWIAVGKIGTDAVYWVDGGSPTVLLPIESGAVSEAHAVNSSGTIAGMSGGHAVVWFSGSQGYDAPCLLELDAKANGIAEATSEGTYVAGAWNASTGPMGAVWLVDATCSFTVSRLDQASEMYGINRAGESVGEGWNAAEHAILWTGDGQIIALPGLSKGASGAVMATAISDDGQWIVGQSQAAKNQRWGVLWMRN